MARIFAIESSCDETSAAVIDDGRRIVSHVTATQIKSHMRFGGVVPEVAGRHHVEAITQVIAAALKEAKTDWDAIDAIAVTKGPGLVGSLLIGITAAKTLALVHNKPLIGTDHIAGHIYANQLVQPLAFPLLALVVSGGHTELVYMPEDGVFQLIGATRDDAVGEAYDKVGRILDVPYPGGKRLDELSQQGEDTYHYPRPMLEEDNYDFSFSGLKSAVINHVHNAEQRGETLAPADLAASFQAAVSETLIEKTLRALAEYPARQLLIAGGVAANSALRNGMQEALAKRYPDVPLLIPPLNLCGDNAAMIGAFADTQYRHRDFSDLTLDAVPGLDITDASLA